MGFFTSMCCTKRDPGSLPDTEDPAPAASEEDKVFEDDMTSDGIHVSSAANSAKYSARDVLSREDYRDLFGTISKLKRSGALGNKEENALYDAIAQKDPRVASAYQVMRDNEDASAMLDLARMRSLEQ